MSMTVGATVRTPDGLIRRVVKLNKTMAPLALLDDDTAYALNAIEPIPSEVAA